MDKRKILKKVIILFTCIFVLIILVSAYVYIHKAVVRKQEAQMKEKAIENAEKNSYSVEFVEENKFYIEIDDEKYYFLIEASGVSFDNCRFFAEEENVVVKEGNVEITITNLDNGKVDVYYHDTRIILLDDGTEMDMGSGSYFVSNTDFEEDSLVIDNFKIDDKQKSIDAYKKIMKLTTVDVLKERYSEGFAICDQLNE